MDFKLEMNQSLKLALSLEMKTSIEILKMSIKELKDYLIAEAKGNSCIEIEYTKNSHKNTDDDTYNNLIENSLIEETLIDHLKEQIIYLDIDKKIKECLEYLIYNLDEKGYLMYSLSELRKNKLFKMETLKRGLEELHKLEPIGVGARDLKECLKIQLLYKKKLNKTLENIIDFNLEDIAYQKFEKIKEENNISQKELEIYLNEIRKLNPKPARGFIVNSTVEYIVPDILVTIEDNMLVIKLNEENSPKIKINKEGECAGLSKALAIARCIEKREETLLKVARFILYYQESNILEEKPLKTLKIKDIAKALDFHESTVSRAIKNKYVKFDNGIRSLKSFIVLNSENESIKKKLENLIENEEKEKPLSDEKLVFMLKRFGFVISRRAVCKYREELGIGSTRERKVKREKL